MRRSRSRGGRSVGTLVTGLVLVLVLTGGWFGAAAFTTGTAERSTAVDVAGDTAGALGIDRSAAVHTNATEPLVNVTNRLGRPVTVTVALRADSTSKGDLVVDGTTVGDQATVSLPRGATRRVDVAVADNSSIAGTSLAFDVVASAPGLRVRGENRTVPIRSGSA